jgi:Spermine/spermidine synthase domain
MPAEGMAPFGEIQAPQEAGPLSPEENSWLIGSISIAAFSGITFTVLAAQIVLSRLLAGTMTYYYAFMLISLAMLGLAAGSLIVQLAPATFRAERFAVQTSLFSIAMGIAAFAGTLAFLRIYPHLNLQRLDSSNSNFLPLTGVFVSIFPLFLLAGLVVSLVLGHGRKQFPKLYAFDLASAALGCALAIVILNAITPVETMLKVIAVIPFLSAALFAVAERRSMICLSAISLAIMTLIGGTFLSKDPNIARPPHIRSITTKTYVNEWNALSSVRVHPGGFFSWCLSPDYKGPAFPMLLLMIDGVGGTSIAHFDGHPQSLERYQYLDFDLTALSQNLVPASGRQLIIGPGGGFDVLQSVRRGRSDISIVEINPLVVSVVNQDLAEFSGSPYRLPGVKFFIENGRTFVKQTNELYNLITLTWVDTGGSPYAVAFSENYLYTVDAYKEYFEHLKPDGIFSFTRSLDYPAIKIDSLRGISVAAQALRELGVNDPGQHMIVAASQSPYFMKSWTMCLVLVKKSAFTRDEIERAREFIAKLGFYSLWLPDGSSHPGPINNSYTSIIRQIITSKDQQELYDSAPFDITPTTDDNPFYFVERSGKNREAGVGIKDLGIYLGIQLILVIPFLIVPLIFRWKDVRYFGATGIAALVYFCLLGAGFMLVEIEFFNVFSMVLGSPTIALATVLSSLLIFCGLGSLLGGRVLGQGKNTMVVTAFAGLLVLLLVFLLFKARILSYLVALPFGVRIFDTILCVAPLAFFMGMPMPAGMTVIQNHRGLVLWGWALNGAFSVFASTAALYLSMNIGIARTFGIGLVSYSLAALLLLYFKGRVLRGKLSPQPA